MTDDSIERFLATDPNGDPNWQPLWGKDGSMEYGKTIPTPQAAIRAFYGRAKTVKALIDSAPKAKDGVKFGSTRAIRAGLAKLALLSHIATANMFVLEQLDTPAPGIQTSRHSPHFAHEEAIQIINQMWLLPLGTDLVSQSTLTHEQIAQFYARFDALQSIVDRLIPEVPPSGHDADSQSDAKADDAVNEPSALTPNQLNVLQTMGIFDRAQLSSIKTITNEMELADRLTDETVRRCILRLIELEYAERPEGTRQGARLTNSGRHLCGKIAD